jgi:hypothetical protein
MNKPMPFQTLNPVCDYMVSLIQGNPQTMLEPTPGAGNLVKALKNRYPDSVISAPQQFWDFANEEMVFDAVVMNPPFTPMIEAMWYLEKCMCLTDQIICLLPWLLLINSSKRFEEIKKWGLVSITHLPRKAFPNSRVQCCILYLRKGWPQDTIIKLFNF